MPGTDQPLPGGGIQAIRMNTRYYKDNMAIKLSLEPDTPGCIHLHRDAGRHKGFLVVSSDKEKMKQGEQA